MKKLLTIILCVSIFSCGVLKKKKTTTSTLTETSLTETKKDSISETKSTSIEKSVESAPIKKQNSISLKTADSIANKKINEALRNFRFYDRSGNNSLKAKYDEETMQLIFDAYIEGTKVSSKESSESTDTSTDTSTVSSAEIESVLKEYIKISRIPWWLYIVAVFLLRNTIFSILKLFIPGLRPFSRVSDYLFSRKKM